MEYTLIIDFLKFIFESAKNAFSDNLSVKNLPINIRFFSLPINKKWFFNKYPYGMEIYLTNKTSKYLFLDEIQLSISNHQFSIMEFATIKDDITSRSALRLVCIQPNKTTKINGIVEVGHGFDFKREILTNDLHLIVKVENKTLNYKMRLTKSVQQKPL